MAAWTTPITWANGSVSAATANTEFRDHFNWIKNGLDNITANTMADSGTGVQMRIIRALAADTAYAARVSGNSFNSIAIRAGGGIEMGDGTAATNVVASMGNGVLQFDRMTVASTQFKLPVKAGAWNDTDIPGYFTGSGSGMIGIDTTNSRIYVRVGSTWKFVNLV